MKKLISLLLIFSITLGCCMTLSSCSNEGAYIKTGNWLELLNKSFGMVSYVEDAPYYSNVTKENKYFSDVQIAKEWNIINSKSIDLDKNVTWKQAMINLVNAGNFLEKDSSDEDKFNYGIENFGSGFRKYWGNRDITYDRAVEVLATAQTEWANKTYEKPIEKVSYKDSTKDLTTKEVGLESYQTDGNKTILKGVVDADLNPGDIYLLPSSEVKTGVSAYKVESINEENGNTVITNSSIEPELGDIVDDIFVQETLVPNASNTVIYDGNGNVISSTPVVQPQSNNLADEQPKITTLSNFGERPQIVNLASKISHKFKVGDWNVGLSYSLGDKLGLEATVGKGESETGKWEVGVGIENFKVTNEIDYSFFKLNSASLRVDYDTNLKFKASINEKVVNKVCAPYNNGNGKGLTNLKAAAFKDAKKAGGNGAQTIKICSIDVWSVGIVRVCLDVNFIVEVDGSFSVTITSHDSKGIEYKNNNVRFINTNDKEVDVQAQAKIEATLGVGPALYTIGLKKPIIGVQAKFGAGASASITLHLVDPEEHLIEEVSAEDMPPEVYKAFVDSDITTDSDSIKRAAEAQGGTYTSESSNGIKLHADVCIDISLYAIIKVELTDTSFVAELLSGKITLSHEFLGAKNGKFASAHIENFDFVSGFKNALFGFSANSKSLCTKKYTSFSKSEKDEGSSSNENAAKENDTIIKGDQIILSEIRTSISIGKVYYPIVNTIPKGYELDDIAIEVSDKKIAKVNKDGSVTGLKEGNTNIIVRTTDKKYYAYCALNVTDNNVVKFTELT